MQDQIKTCMRIKHVSNTILAQYLSMYYYCSLEKIKKWRLDFFFLCNSWLEWFELQDSEGQRFNNIRILLVRWKPWGLLVWSSFMHKHSMFLMSWSLLPKCTEGTISCDTHSEKTAVLWQGCRFFKEKKKKKKHWFFFLDFSISLGAKVTT